MTRKLGEDFNCISADEYQLLSSRTAINTEMLKKPLTIEQKRLVNWALGIGGESGEILDHIKKYLFHGGELDRDYIKKEIGDNIWYQAQLAKDLGFSLSECLGHNIAKLERRHPKGFTVESAQAKLDEKV